MLIIYIFIIFLLFTAWFLTLLFLTTNLLKLWRPTACGDFLKKTLKHTWLCAGVSLVR